MLTAPDNELLTQVGPGTPMGDLFRRFWLPAMALYELPEPDCAPVRLRLLGEDLVAWRDTSGRVGVMRESCPHRGASMFFGRNEEDGLRCVYHGWKFDTEGRCIDMPNEPAESNFKHKISAAAYPAQEYGGLIWVYMGPRDRLPELPALEASLAPDDHRMVSKLLQRSNWAQQVEGNIDSAHVSFLHRWFDRSQSPSPDAKRRSEAVWAARDGDGSPYLQVKETDYGFIYGARRNAPDDQYYWRCTPFMLPAYTITPSVDWPRGWLCLVPADDHSTWWFSCTFHPTEPIANFAAARQLGRPSTVAGTFVLPQNLGNDFLIDREVQRTANFTGLPNNRVQDQAVTDSMGLVMDRTKEHLGTTDLAIIAMRRVLMRAAVALQQGVEPYQPAHPEVYRVRPLHVVNRERDFGALLDNHRDDIVPAAQ